MEDEICRNIKKAPKTQCFSGVVAVLESSLELSLTKLYERISKTAFGILPASNREPLRRTVPQFRGIRKDPQFLEESHIPDMSFLISYIVSTAYFRHFFDFFYQCVTDIRLLIPVLLIDFLFEIILRIFSWYYV